MRLTVSNESGYYLDLHLYQEIADRESGQVKFMTWGGGKTGVLHGLPVSTPYQTKDHLQQKRYLAQKMGTTFVYDFPEMFRQALLKLWREHNAERPSDDEPNNVEILQGVELVLDENGELTELNRLPGRNVAKVFVLRNFFEIFSFPGENECSMVAWRLTMKTPEYPEGRDLVVIANDLTHLIGSFGVKEDQLFAKASEMSRRLGIPRVYIAGNSGARIGLADEVKQSFRIAWDDPEQPDKGFKYLYVTPDEYRRMNSATNVVQAVPIEDENETR